jgi:hypothetical protein
MVYRIFLASLVLVSFGGGAWSQGVEQTSLQMESGSIMPTWDVKWYVLTAPEAFGPAPIGRSTFPLEFSHDWGSGPLFLTYSDRIGFKASTIIYVPFKAEVGFRFVATARNGLELYIDGHKVFDYYAVVDDVNVDEWYVLSPGLHRLELRYQHWTGVAYIAFEVGIESDAALWFVLALQQELEALNEQIRVLQQRVAALEEEIDRLRSQ